MATVFVSHSSKDREFATKLAEDLSELGHRPWLDQWEIRVGECIPSRIEQGVSGADYVVIILSPNSVESGWVDREWKTKYWDEIEQRRTLVLPVLLHDCKIPELLKTKKYADFRRNYATGLVELMSAIPTIRRALHTQQVKPLDYGSDISALLAEIQSRTLPLSQSLTKALAIAQQAADPSLERFCRNELAGWPKAQPSDHQDEEPTYRLVPAFASSSAQINMQYWGWGGNVSSIFEHMRRDTEDFLPITIMIGESVSAIESSEPGDRHKTILTMTVRLGHFDPTSETPDSPVFVYLRADAYALVLEAIRTELTRRLLGLLPTVGSE